MPLVETTIRMDPRWKKEMAEYAAKECGMGFGEYVRWALDRFREDDIKPATRRRLEVLAKVSGLQPDTLINRLLSRWAKLQDTT